MLSIYGKDFSLMGKKKKVNQDEEKEIPKDRRVRNPPKSNRTPKSRGKNKRK